MEDGLTNSKMTIGGKEPPTMKEKITSFLFDKNNPEMITFLYDSEIMHICAVEEVIKGENDLRKRLNLSIEPNPFLNYLRSLKVHRTSRKGWRSEQAVKIINSSIEDESGKSGFNKLGGLFGSGKQ